MCMHDFLMLACITEAAGMAVYNFGLALVPDAL